MINVLPGERWRPVPGYEDSYLISDHGRVYALAKLVAIRPDRKPAARRGRVLKPNPTGVKRNYLQVKLQRHKKCWNVKVHQLVMLAFVGPCPDGMEVLHWDDDAQNNHISNLRYGTPVENAEDKKRNGRTGVKTHCINNHEFTPENTYLRPGGKTRACKECSRQRGRDRRRKSAEQIGKVA